MGFKQNVIDTIDKGLYGYYAEFKSDDSSDAYNGKFKAYVEANDFDDDAVAQELEQEATECLLTEFDANFPLHAKISDENAKKEEIFKILKYIATNGYTCPIPLQKNGRLKLTEDDSKDNKYIQKETPGNNASSDVKTEHVNENLSNEGIGYNDNIDNIDMKKELEQLRKYKKAMEQKNEEWKAKHTKQQNIINNQKQEMEQIEKEHRKYEQERELQKLQMEMRHKQYTEQENRIKYEKEAMQRIQKQNDIKQQLQIKQEYKKRKAEEKILQCERQNKEKELVKKQKHWETQQQKQKQTNEKTAQLKQKMKRDQQKRKKEQKNDEQQKQISENRIDELQKELDQLQRKYDRVRTNSQQLENEVKMQTEHLKLKDEKIKFIEQQLEAEKKKIQEIADRDKKREQERQEQERIRQEMQEKENKDRLKKEQQHKLALERQKQIKQKRKELRLKMLKAQQLDITRCNKWQSDDVVTWIMTLENGAFKQYEQMLITDLEKRKIDGNYLLNNNVECDEIQHWGINSLDSKTICSHILFIKSWKKAQQKMQKYRLYNNPNIFKNKVFDEKNVKNVMVISIAIAEFDNQEPLMDVIQDVRNYQNVLRDDYGYVFISNIDFENRKDYGYELSDERLNDFLLNCKSKLFATHDASEVLYDALIITISSHGNTSGIICSNGLVITYAELRDIFCDELLVKIPRIYMIDACRNSDGKMKEINDIYVDMDEKNNETELSDPPKANTMSATLMATSEGHSVRGGKLSKHITEIFKSNYEKNKKLLKKQYMEFGEICRIVDDNIQNETNKVQALKLNENSPHINNIIFKPNDDKRGYGGEDENAQQSDHTAIYEMLDDLEDELDGEDQVKMYQEQFDIYNYEELEQIINDTDSVLQELIENEQHRAIITNKAQTLLSERELRDT